MVSSCYNFLFRFCFYSAGFAISSSFLRLNCIFLSNEYASVKLAKGSVYKHTHTYNGIKISNDQNVQLKPSNYLNTKDNGKQKCMIALSVNNHNKMCIVL